MPSITTPAPAGQTVRRLTTHGRTRRKKKRIFANCAPDNNRSAPEKTNCAVNNNTGCTLYGVFFRNVPSITTAAQILQFGNCAPDNNPTAGNVRWITTRSGHVWKADEIPKCAADNNSRILPTAQIVLWITTCRPQKKVQIVRPITTIFFALRCTPHRNCAADNNPARRKLCGGFQCRLPGIVCRITTCIKEAARQTVPPITIQPVENCAADSNPRCPAPAENVRRITTPPTAEKNAAGVGTNGTV